jgi:hypothetical protein
MFTIGSPNKQKGKYRDKERDRFCKETTYAAEFKRMSKKQDEYNKQIDNQIVSKYSNRIPKSAKAMSMDRTQHRNQIEDYKRRNSVE